MQKTNNSNANVGVKTSLKIMLTIFSILSLSGCGAQGMHKKHKQSQRHPQLRIRLEYGRMCQWRHA